MELDIYKIGIIDTMNSKGIELLKSHKNFNVDIKSDIREATKEAELIIIAAPLNAYKEIFLAIKNMLLKLLRWQISKTLKGINYL